MSKHPTADTDPVAYANRPADAKFDPYLSVREMLVKLIAGGKA